MRIQRFRSNRGAFALTELMIASTLLVVVLAGLLTAHFFGLKLLEITKAKLGANNEARRAISLLIEEIRTGKRVKIGSGTLSSFTEVPPNTAQLGSAIQIYPGADTNDFIRYFWDSTQKQLMRTTDGAMAVSVVANSITNSLVFAARNFKGDILTNNHNNRVIELTLQFYQIQYPIVAIGPGQFYDYYQLRTRITRRALE